IGVRAVMVALPIEEKSGAPCSSGLPGKMHACGHDGHTTMLLGAARYLAETRNFSGRVALIFQPAEEGGGGGDIMVKEGMMDRFAIDEVYGMHNAPNHEEGALLTAPGPVMAAVDTFHIDIEGKGGHGAMPHETRDPVIAAVGMASAIQTIVSRNHQATQDLVVSVTQIHTGTADNVIPDTAYINGTVRTFDKAVQAMVKERLAALIAGHAAAYDVEAELRYEMGYPATVNDASKAAFATEVAREIAAQVDGAVERQMGAEDFSYMLEARPGAYLFLGQGDGPTCHNPSYDFNDEIAPIGASFFARLVERAAPLKAAS
ncbi:MAG: amidohydrolase, partial [Pseudomonadota bacterium]